MNNLAFLFDIDGVLTLPNTEQRKFSVIDSSLIEFLFHIHQQNVKFAFITGRAYPWVTKFLLSKFHSFLEDIPIFMEYGLTSLIYNKVTISDSAISFRNEYFDLILSSIQQTCQIEGVFFEPTPFVDYPDHGSLWLEKKDGMISIASNKLISPRKVHQIVNKSIIDILDNLRIVNHHLGCDILPKGFGKEQAAIKSFQLLDPHKKVRHWYIFGDNESDKEMCNPFKQSTFIDTKIGASESTRKHLKSILADLLYSSMKVY